MEVADKTDVNLKRYYFLILEDNLVKLVTASVASQPFTYTVIPIANADNSGNIGLEFSNETNTIYFFLDWNNFYQFSTSTKLSFVYYEGRFVPNENYRPSYRQQRLLMDRDTKWPE